MSDFADLAEAARKGVDKALKAFNRHAAVARAYQDIYNTPQGKTALEDLMRKGGILEVALDPDDSRFYDGRRSLALEIVRMLRFSESEMVALARAQSREDAQRLVD